MVQCLCRGRQIACAPQGERGDGLNRRQGIFDAVVQFIEKQTLKVFVLFPGDGDRGRAGPTHDLELGDVHFDVSRRHPGIARRRGSDHHPSGGEHDAFDSECLSPLHDRRRRPLGAQRQLDEAVPIAEIDEHETAEIASAMDPTAQPDDLVDLSFGEGSSSMAAELGGGH